MTKLNKIVMDVKVETENGVKVIGMHNTIKLSDIMRDKNDR